MNAAVIIDRLPLASEFAVAMWEKVQDGYPRVMSVVATAILQAGGDRDAIVRMAGSKANRAAFLMGCCAEELVSTGFAMKGRDSKRYIGELIEALRPLAQPIRSKRVAPDFRRLLREYEQHPVRMRVRTIQYMLVINGLEHEQTIVSANAACQLQIECSVTVDGVAGCLIEMMKPEESASPESAVFTTVSENLGPMISSKLHRLPQHGEYAEVGARRPQLQYARALPCRAPPVSLQIDIGEGPLNQRQAQDGAVGGAIVCFPRSGADGRLSILDPTLSKFGLAKYGGFRQDGGDLNGRSAPFKLKPAAFRMAAFGSWTNQAERPRRNGIPQVPMEEDDGHDQRQEFHGHIGQGSGALVQPVMAASPLHHNLPGQSLPDAPAEPPSRVLTRVVGASRRPAIEGQKKSAP